MTTTTTAPQVLMPAGAHWVDDEWNDDGEDQTRFFHHPKIHIGEATVSIEGVQYADGRTSRAVRIEASDGNFTPRYARKVAAMLQNLADTCEILDGIGLYGCGGAK
jgi:hypothetical protein